MTIDNMLHLIAGFFVVVSVILGVYVSPYFFLFPGFVGLNLIQSAFSGWCPMMTFLKWMGFRTN
jgi:hypothetical protein